MPIPSAFLPQTPVLPKKLDVGRGNWYHGYPPSIGWWPADSLNTKDLHTIRWWNGRRWSTWFSEKDHAIYDSPEEFDSAVLFSQPTQGSVIVWRHRATWWPDRSFT